MSVRRPEPAANPARGLALVAAAVVVGFVLIRSGLDTSSTVSTGGDGGRERTTTSAAASSTTTATGTTARPPSQVTVLVANGSGIDGAATRLTETLAGKGYRSAAPTNTGRVTATAVFHVPGFAAEARAVAVAFGAPASAAAAMPNPPPVSDLAGAHVLVLLGPDLAPKG